MDQGMGACAFPRNVEGGDSAVLVPHEAVIHGARITVNPRDHAPRVDGYSLSALEGACACARRIECDNGGLWAKERRLAEIQDTIVHADSQQPRKREEQANANEYVLENFCSHKNFFLSFPAELILGSCWDSEEAKNLARESPPSDSDLV